MEGDMRKGKEISHDIYGYMMEKYLGKDKVAGDLAYDMNREKETFPMDFDAECEDAHNSVRGYLVRGHAGRECPAVFERCWKQYGKEVT